MNRVYVYDAVALRRALLLVSIVIALVSAGSAVASGSKGHNLGDTKMALGQTYTITGRTAGRVDGTVLLTGRWAGDHWRLITRTTTHGDGTYRLVVKPNRRGQLELRLATPDHRVARVVLTVT
jgi:hypothetical protein